MSKEFTLTGSKLKLADWNGLLYEWAESVGMPGEPPEFEPSEDEYLAHLVAPGCIRGCVFHFSPKKREARLAMLALAGPADWDLAFSILRKAVKKGGGSVTDDNGENHSPAQLSDRAARACAEQWFVFTYNSLWKNQQQKPDACFQIPMGHFRIPLSLKGMSACDASNWVEVAEDLAGRFERYLAAFVGSVMRLDDGQTMATWALIPTIIQHVDLLCIDFKDIMVPIDHVKKVLGDRMEDLGGTYFLPELDSKRDRALLQKLALGNVDK
ncbi:MAG: hypothetical protein KIS92_05160 [Planctomycetota bacterium]|nr:hypothetical protein [Planctomycetota bacterium]